MGDVGKILEGKGSGVVRIDGDATVLDAVRTMVDANVGAILVTGGSDRIEGIFTERDYLRRVAVQGRDERETPVSDVMTREVLVVTPDTSVAEAMALMTDRRIRHAPVVVDGELRGMISIGDLVKLQSQQQDYRIQYLTEYISAG
jgi:CBS domain-containing protein